jgi:ABC-type taurine transport system substrate-binding protein
MNLKKSTGGYVTDNVAMQQVATEDKALFKRQFGLYHPDVIIACGSSVSDTFFDIIEEEDPKWLQTSRGINYTKLSGSEVFISFSHPEARIQDSLLYYGLIDTVKEIVYIR